MPNDPVPQPTPIEKDEKRLREKYGLDRAKSDGIAYSSAGMEMAMIVVVCAAIGWGIDYLLKTTPWFLLGACVFGIIGAMYRLILRFGGTK